MGDATKATITIESPGQNQTFRTPSVEVRGYWRGATLTNPKVEIKLGPRSSGPITPDASGNWSYTFDPVADGRYEVVAYLRADSKEPVDHGPIIIKVAAGVGPGG